MHPRESHTSKKDNKPDTDEGEEPEMVGACESAEGRGFRPDEIFGHSHREFPFHSIAYDINVP